MKRSILLSLAGLTLVAACTDNPTRPTDAVPAPQGAFKPQGPVRDNIFNNVDGSIDAAPEVMPLTLGGANGTTTLFVDPTGGDGKSGCNLTGSTTLVISASSSNTSVATVGLSNATFTSCGDTKTLTVTPVGQGTTTISVVQTSNNTGATFNFAPATFTVNVSPPPNTAPTITVTGVTGGFSYNKGSVPTATCQVVDAEDGNSSPLATLSAVTGPYASDGIGSQTASCSYTDGGGLMASSSLTYSIVDPSAPSISDVLSPAAPDGSNGWYNSAVTLTWTVTESESPNSLQKTNCVDQNITADQDAATYSCSATSAGGSTGPVDVTIKRDGTAPTYSVARTPAANSSGWNKSAVTVAYNWADATSGLATCSEDEVLSNEGASQSATGNCSDIAGNASTASVTNVNIDLTKPTVALVGGPADGGSYYFGSVPAAPTCSASDALSGLNGPCAVSGYALTVGSHTVSVSASDKADNQASTSAQYNVLAWSLRGFYQPVDMSGVVNTVKAGSTVPLKFNVFAGANELTDVSVVKSFVQTKITCDANATVDEIEVTSTGGTTLRYDATGKQFIQNWQTPKSPGTCYRVTMTTQDGSPIAAFFKLK